MIIHRQTGGRPHFLDFLAVFVRTLSEQVPLQIKPSGMTLRDAAAVKLATDLAKGIPSARREYFSLLKFAETVKNNQLTPLEKATRGLFPG